MKKKVLYTTVWLCSLIMYFTANTNAQEFHYSNPQKFGFKNGIFDIIGKSGDRIYTFRADNNGYFVDAYNDQMELKAVVNLDFFPQATSDVYFVNHAEGMAVLYQAKQANHIVQYAALLDSKARLTQPAIALDTLYNTNKSRFVYDISFDKSRIAIHGMVTTKKVNTIQTILLDNNLNVIYKIKKDAPTEEFSPSHSLLANNGNLYLVQSGIEKEENLLQVFEVNTEGKMQELTKYPLLIKKLSGLYIKMDNKTNSIYLGAFYSSKKGKDNEGIFFGKYTVGLGEQGIFKTLPFDETIMSSVSLKRAQRVLNEYEVRDIIVRNDGGFILVSENYYVTSRGAATPGFYGGYYGPSTMGGRSVTEYNFGDIMTLSYNAEGERQWHFFVRKLQTTFEDRGLFSSYGFMNTGGNLAFVFNDFNTSKSTLTVAAVNGNGESNINKINPKLLMPKYDIAPNMGKQISEREIVFPYLKGNNLGFVKVAF